jgi:hypothetical protein
LLKHPAESSAFVGHGRLLSAGYPNLRDSVPLRYRRASSEDFSRAVQDCRRGSTMTCQIPCTDDYPRDNRNPFGDR